MNKLARIIEQEKPDIIHAHGWILYSVLPLRKKYGIPIVATLHGYGYFCPRTNLVRGNSICHDPSLSNCIQCTRGDYGIIRSLAAYQGISVNKNRLKSVDRFIATSSFVKDSHLRHLRLEDQDVLVIPNFYKPDTGSGEKSAVNPPADFILFVGTLAPYKGLDLLIEAYRKLDTPTKMLVMGYRYLNYLYQSTDNMIVVTNVPHDNVMQAISKCRFAVLPSICPDAFPLVTLEAMSEGKAVIASDIGSFGEIVVNDRTGILVRPNDSDKLAEAMSCLLQKPELAAKMGEYGYRRFVENYTPNIVIPKIIDMYKSLIGV
jgi:glycosyltransferase involved in cell wall biosynthesis